MNFWGIVPAAGAGKRMGADRPKQYLPLVGATVIEHTLTRLLAAAVLTKIVVALAADDGYWDDLAIARHPQILRAPGGKERADSVLSGLRALDGVADDDDWVLVHDAARPCITTGDITRLITTLHDDPVGGTLALPCHDTLKQVDQHGAITATLDRNRIWRALTPQMCRYRLLRDALQHAARSGKIVTDEMSALEAIGHQPRIVEGRPDNLKITRPEDLALAQFYLAQQTC